MIGDIPDSLSELGREYWDNLVTPLIVCGVATELDLHALIMMVESYATWRTELDKLRNESFIHTSDSGYNSINTRHSVVKNAQSEFLRLPKE